MPLTSFRWSAACCAAVLLFGWVSSASAQQDSAVCDPRASAPFLSAASDIQSGCGYLLESTPPQYALAASNFRLALAKEPNNAVAHYLLGISLAASGESETAQAAMAEARRIDPQILGKIGPLFESHPALRAAVEGRPATPRTTAAPVATPGPASGPTTRPVPTAGTAPAAPSIFPVGAKVEIEYRPGEWFQGVVTQADAGACPYYRVRADVYGNGNPSNLGYGCKSVRAPTGIGPTVAACGGSNPNCAPKSPPPLGRYACNVTVWDVTERRNRYDYKGYFEILPGGRYRWLDNGGSGTYTYDPKTYAVTWGSGPLRSQGGRASYGLDGATPEITIAIDTESTRRAGNAPILWQCAPPSR